MAGGPFYILGSAAVSPGWFGQLQDGGTAPTAGNTAFGWQVNKLPVNYYQAFLGATAASIATGASTSFISAKTGPTAGTGSGATTAGDSFISPTAYNGSF